MVYRLLLASLFLLPMACGVKQAKETESKVFNVADFPNVDNSLYGGWEQDDKSKDSKGITKTTRVYFNDKNEMGYAVTCSIYPEAVDTKITINVDVSDDKIEVKGTFHSEEKGSGKIDTCALDIVPTVLKYNVQGDRLFMITETNHYIALTRIR